MRVVAIRDQGVLHPQLSSRLYPPPLRSLRSSPFSPPRLCAALTCPCLQCQGTCPRMARRDDETWLCWGRPGADFPGCSNSLLRSYVSTRALYPMFLTQYPAIQPKKVAETTPQASDSGAGSQPLPPPPQSSISLYELSFGTVCGVCAGVFVKKGARIVAFALGGIFVLLQVSIPHRPQRAQPLEHSMTVLWFPIAPAS